MSNSRNRKQKKKKAKIAATQHKLNKERKDNKSVIITLTEERKDEIKNEAQRRIKLWLKNSTFDEMTVMGSKMRFDMALGLLGGYPFEEPEWMKDNSFSDFITEQEFNSNDYVNIIQELFDESEKKLSTTPKHIPTN